MMRTKRAEQIAPSSGRGDLVEGFLARLASDLLRTWELSCESESNTTSGDYGEYSTVPEPPIRDLPNLDGSQREPDYRSDHDSQERITNIPADNTFKVPSESSSELNMDDLRGCDERDTPTLAPGKAEVFTCAWESGENYLGMHLTSSMVALWNQIFQLEDKREYYAQKLSRLMKKEVVAARQLSDMNRRAINAESDESEHQMAREAAAQKLQDVQRMAGKREILERKLRQNMADLTPCIKQMCQDWRRILAEGHVLEETLNGSGNQAEGVQDGTGQEARSVRSKERRDAIKDFRIKKRVYKDAYNKIDHWNLYYDQEKRKFLRGERDGISPTARTEFDHSLLREHSFSVDALDTAEREMEESYERACQLGLMIDYNSSKRGSGFSSGDESPPASLEGEVRAQNVDRDMIESWMADGEKMSYNYLSMGSDAPWECRSIEQWESQSAVGRGKYRAKIDGWRQMCEQINP